MASKQVRVSDETFKHVTQFGDFGDSFDVALKKALGLNEQEKTDENNECRTASEAGKTGQTPRSF